MKLSQLIAVIEDRSPFPISQVRRSGEGYIAIIGTLTPDGQEAVVSVMISALELGEAISDDTARMMAETRVDQAVASLERYAASFAPPKWDEQVWA